jgi:hypothetical protein
MLKNNKAQGLSVNAIILIIIGIVVLVVLILGFTMGWSGFKSWFGSSDNIDQIVTQCSVACSSSQKNAYCFQKRVLKQGDEEKEDVTCYTLAKSLQYGVDDCPSISCGIYDKEHDAIAGCQGKSKGTKNYYIENLKIEEFSCP